MRRALSTMMAASLVLRAGEPFSFDSFRYQHDVLRWLGTTDTTRTRFPGRHRPAGTKLARKAFKGRVGLATIR